MGDRMGGEWVIDPIFSDEEEIFLTGYCNFFINHLIL